MNKDEKKIWEYLLKYRADFDNGLRADSSPVRKEIAIGTGIGETMINWYLERWNKNGVISLIRGHRNIVLGETKLLKVKHKK